MIEINKELLPCPFCGDSGHLIEDTAESTLGVVFTVACYNENCIEYHNAAAFDRRSDAIKAWNTRATRPTPSVNQELLNAAQEALDCFNAAYIEGLAEKLGEQDIFEVGSLADLVNRRILYAMPLLEQAISKANAQTSVNQELLKALKAERNFRRVVISHTPVYKHWFTYKMADKLTKQAISKANAKAQQVKEGG